MDVAGTASLTEAADWSTCLSFFKGPLCPELVVTHGALVCRSAANGQQSCDLICYHGYYNTLPVSSFLCETETQRWGGDRKPLSGACQSKSLLKDHIVHYIDRLL